MRLQPQIRLAEGLPEPTQHEFRMRALRHGNKLIFVEGASTYDVGLETNERAFLLDDDLSLARKCALALLSNLKEGCGGDLNRVVRCLKLTALINCDAKFMDHPKVADAASDLFVQVFGESGKHVRSAIGVDNLPSGVAIQMHAAFEIRR